MTANLSFALPPLLAAVALAVPGAPPRVLPEVVVESKKHAALHILAYVREYSTLTHFSDTVFLFREKTVDFMVPALGERRYKGWTRPRILASRSYYRFSDPEGLDSVSGRYGRHFSWSDWVGILRDTPLPVPLQDSDEAADTVWGRYGPAEIWGRHDGEVRLKVDVLADESARRWAPGLFRFADSGLDLRRMTMAYVFEGAGSSVLTADNISRLTFSIESNGRGRALGPAWRDGSPGYVETRAELYVMGKEYVSVSEARKREDAVLLSEEVGICAPPDAPGLPSSVAELVERVGRIDCDALRLNEKPDRRLAGKRDFGKPEKKGFLRFLKTVLGH